MSFDSFQIDSALLAGVRDLGFEQPTDIQQDAIPWALEGRDVLACAMTGSGKTAAFGLPILERLLGGPRGRTRALILSPTRELASQIDEHLRQLGAHTGIRVAPIYGGVAYEPQEKAFREGYEILVATPGRLLDHLRRPYAGLDDLEVLVLDEADRMLDMGFIPDVRRILQRVPKDRQTLFFSATLPSPIVRLAGDMLRDPVTINLERKSAPAEGVRQAAYPVRHELKPALLLHLLGKHAPESALVFCRTRERADLVGEYLRRAGEKVAVIHGSRTQQHRTKAMDSFKAGRYRILVATDVAARGIDIEELDVVVNLDVPSAADDYIHRVGRTARAGATGDAWTFVAARELADLHLIEKTIGKKLERIRLEDFDYAPNAATVAALTRPPAKIEVPVLDDEEEDVVGETDAETAAPEVETAAAAGSGEAAPVAESVEPAEAADEEEEGEAPPAPVARPARPARRPRGGAGRRTAAPEPPPEVEDDAAAGTEAGTEAPPAAPEPEEIAAAAPPRGRGRGRGRRETATGVGDEAVAATTPRRRSGRDAADAGEAEPSEPVRAAEPPPAPASRGAAEERRAGGGRAKRAAKSPAPSPGGARRPWFLTPLDEDDFADEPPLPDLDDELDEDEEELAAPAAAAAPDPAPGDRAPAERPAPRRSRDEEDEERRGRGRRRRRGRGGRSERASTPAEVGRQTRGGRGEGERERPAEPAPREAAERLAAPADRRAADLAERFADRRRRRAGGEGGDEVEPRSARSREEPPRQERPGRSDDRAPRARGGRRGEDEAPRRSPAGADRSREERPAARPEVPAAGEGRGGDVLERFARLRSRRAGDRLSRELAGGDEEPAGRAERRDRPGRGGRRPEEQRHAGRDAGPADERRQGPDVRVSSGRRGQAPAGGGDRRAAEAGDERRGSGDRGQAPAGGGGRRAAEVGAESRRGGDRWQAPAGGGEGRAAEADVDRPASGDRGRRGEAEPRRSEGRAGRSGREEEGSAPDRAAGGGERGTGASSVRPGRSSGAAAAGESRRPGGGRGGGPRFGAERAEEVDEAGAGGRAGGRDAGAGRGAWWAGGFAAGDDEPTAAPAAEAPRERSRGGSGRAESANRGEERRGAAAAEAPRGRSRGGAGRTESGGGGEAPREAPPQASRSGRREPREEVARGAVAGDEGRARAGGRRGSPSPAAEPAGPSAPLDERAAAVAARFAALRARRSGRRGEGEGAERD
jgi:ATP-dependent RNA helicase RhlE